MNILFLSTKSPYPIKDGHSSRTYNVLQQLSRNHRVYFLTYFLSEAEEQGISSLKPLIAESRGFRLQSHRSLVRSLWCWLRSVFSCLPFVAIKYRTPEMTREIRRILAQQHIDAVHLDLLPLMVYADLFKRYPMVLVNHNVESELLQRRIPFVRNPVLRLVLRHQYGKLFAFEREAIGRVDCCIAVSERDKQLLSQMNPTARLHVLPNGVDTEYFRPSDTPQANTLLYVGGMDWFPNADAISYFTDQILPKLRESNVDMSIQVIGKIPAGYQRRQGIEYLGFVDDIRPYVARAKVYIVPLRVGGGTRLKILDALAMGKAVVTTSVGCEGLEVIDGQEVLIRDTPEAFAAAVKDILCEEDLRTRLSIAARERAVQTYDWDVLGRSLQRIYNTLHKTG